MLPNETSYACPVVFAYNQNFETVNASLTCLYRTKRPETTTEQNKNDWIENDKRRFKVLYFLCNCSEFDLGVTKKIMLECTGVSHISSHPCLNGHCTLLIRNQDTVHPLLDWHLANTESRVGPCLSLLLSFVSRTDAWSWPLPNFTPFS